MIKKESFGCIQYIKKQKRIVMSYSVNNNDESVKVVIANLKDMRIKNDYELMCAFFTAVNRNTKAISPGLKKFCNVTKLLSQDKQIKFKTDRVTKKTYVMLPAIENGGDEWVKAYPAVLPFVSIAKAVMEYNKLVEEKNKDYEK